VNLLINHTHNEYDFSIANFLSYSNATYARWQGVPAPSERSPSRSTAQSAIAPNIGFLKYETVLILMRLGVILKE